MNAVITFRLDNRVFGIGIERIGEILTYEELFKVFSDKEWFAGVMNVRGTAMPVVDLRIRFRTNLKPVYDKTTVIIAVKTDGGKRIGYIIDEIKDILTIEGQRVFQPSQNDGMGAGFIKGYIVEGSQTIAVFDVDKLLGRADIEELERAGA